MITDEFVDQKAEHEAFVYATQADWHNAWHAENGPAGCPWDCAASDRPCAEELLFEAIFSARYPVTIDSPNYCDGPAAFPDDPPF